MAVADPAGAGERMLASLAEGRQRAIEQSQARAAALRKVVLQAARDDEARGRPMRGARCAGFREFFGYLLRLA